MATSMTGLVRSCRCAELEHLIPGRQVTLMGWCHHIRDLGRMLFITLRDRSGEIQLIVEDKAPDELRALAASVRPEYVLAASGHIRERSDPNPRMMTGQIELVVNNLRILSESDTPPFYIEPDSEANEALRLTHRYLDLRRPDQARRIMQRDQIVLAIRRYFAAEGFIDIETPMLGRSTPEGARDYLVPSRVKPGSFYALPQSPQLYKQLLMLAGFDRYIQIARCFRDEDLRADRQPEFTQVDLEMSFVSPNEVMDIVERGVAKVASETVGIQIPLPLQRLTWQEAMRRFGSDKPDLRFDMELQDVSQLPEITKAGFAPFDEAIATGGSAIALVVPDGGRLSRREIDDLGNFVKTYRLGGLPWLVPGPPVRGSIRKFFDDAATARLATAIGAGANDLILFGCGSTSVVQTAMGQLRVEVATRMNMIDPDRHELLWVTEFPLFEAGEPGDDRLYAKHHPFTRPLDADIDLLETDPLSVRAAAYDIVMDGVELGGGSIRIHESDLQRRMLALLGFTEEAARDSFGFLLEAFRYGAPPHGGLAFGLDRFVMLLTGARNIREVIAFPKVQSAADLMTGAPAPVAPEQLEELDLLLGPTAARAISESEA
ncbi:MAG: aspartate--tRNA ligase [Bacillota bacterium]|nr:aspartate--tRNA ligase [Bacillota bacterium]